MTTDSEVVTNEWIRNLALRELCASYSDPDYKPRSLDVLADAAMVEVLLNDDQDTRNES